MYVTLFYILLFVFLLCFNFICNSLAQVNQVILAKKRRLSQTDSGKSRKPVTQAMVVTMPATGSESRQEVVVNGDNDHTPTEVANDDLLQTKDDAFYSRPPSVGSTNSSGTEITSPQEPDQPSCSGNNMYAKYCIARMFGGVNVWRISELKEIAEIKFGEWVDFGHKDTIYKLKLGWLKFGESQTTRQICQTLPLPCIPTIRKG